MAAKKTTGIIPTMIKYGGGISAVRALPKAKGKRPAVIILHERYGIDQHTKDLTVKLAQAGFVGLAPDLISSFCRRSQSSLERRAKGRSQRRRRFGGFERRGGIFEKTERSRRRADRHYRRLPNRPATGAAGGKAQ